MNFHKPIIAKTYRRHNPKEGWWTDKRVQELKTLWSEGEGAIAVACAMGTTRNAIIGKAHRLGLTRLCGVVKLKKGERVRRQWPSSRAIRSTRLKTKRTTEPPQSKHLTFDQISAGMCRYIADDYPPWTYCAHDAAPGSSWCAYHEGVVFTAGKAP